MSSSSRKAPESTGRLIAFMALFVLLAVPLVAYLWETLNELLALKVDPPRLLIALPVLLLFIGLLWVLSRQLRRFQA